MKPKIQADAQYRKISRKRIFEKIKSAKGFFSLGKRGNSTDIGRRRMTRLARIY